MDTNKILNTKVGDDIHFYVNGDEGRGIVVKMSNEYVMVAKENGDFQDIHINDTFFIKDIVVNKTWDLMDDTDRYESLMKIHAPSHRFVAKPWAELPKEIKDLLTKNNGVEASHKKEDDMDSDWRGEKEGKTQETRDDDKEEDKKEDKEDKKEKKKVDEISKRQGEKIGGGEKDTRSMTDRFNESSEALGVDSNTKEGKDVHRVIDEHISPVDINTLPSERSSKYAKENVNRSDINKAQGGTVQDKVLPEKYQDAKGRKGGMARNAQNEAGGQTSAGQATEARGAGTSKLSGDKKLGNPLKLAAWQLWLQDKASSGDINTKRKPKVNQTVTGGGAHNVTTESGGFKLNQSIANQKEKPTIGLGSKITTRQLDTETGKETNIRERSTEELPKESKGKKGEKGSDWLAYFHEHKDDKKAAWQEFLDKSKQFAKIYGGKSKSDGFKKLKPVYEGDTKQAKKEKSDVEHGKYGGISTDTAYDIPKNTGYEERPHISLEEAGRLPRTTFNESGSELTVPKGGKKEIGTFKAPPAIQKKLEMVKELMGITDNGATNVVYGGSDNKYATALQNSTTKGRADNQVEDRE